MKLLAEISLYFLATKGLMSVIGIPPVSYWFKSHTCDKCEGVGWVKDKHENT